MNVEINVHNHEREKLQQLWEQYSVEVESITDGLGLGVDAGIKEAVVGCKANTVETIGSCEGHTDHEHGLPYPWIDISCPEPENWKSDDQVKADWQKQNSGNTEKAASLLKEFYSNRQPNDDAKLVLENKGIYGAVRLRSAGADKLEHMEREKTVASAQKYRAEMLEFAKFLKEKFISI